MSTLLVDNPRTRIASLVVPLLIAFVGLLFAGDALAIDGNYSSPYASQWDTRGPVATISDEALLGVLLLLVNALITSFYALRHRLKQHKPGD